VAKRVVVTGSSSLTADERLNFAAGSRSGRLHCRSEIGFAHAVSQCFECLGE